MATTIEALIGAVRVDSDRVLTAVKKAMKGLVSASTMPDCLGYICHWEEIITGVGKSSVFSRA